MYRFKVLQSLSALNFRPDRPPWPVRFFYFAHLTPLRKFPPSVRHSSMLFCIIQRPNNQPKTDIIMKLIRFALPLLLLLIFQPALHAQDAVPEDFESWVEEKMEIWGIPGLAVSVVKGDEVVYASGFGVKQLGSNEPVDEHTQFGIASVSKHMTASALGILVDRGFIDWDDKVIDHINWFELSDPWATANVTIRDLLTHQVGVGRMLGNRLQFMTNRDPEELIYRMRYHDFEQPFRSDYVYSNMMYSTAGQIITEVSGLSFGEFLERHFFGPMEMTRTNSSIYDIVDGDNAAYPHQEIEGEVQEIQRRSWDNAAPAGGVNSSVTDMATWMRMQLGNAGYLDGERILHNETMRDIQTPKVSQPIGSQLNPQRSYGFGLSITDYEGHRVLSHGGATDGFNTIYMLVPEKELGVIVVTNLFSSFQQAIAYSIVDHHLEVEEPTDWHERYWSNYQDRYDRAMERREEFEAKRQEDTSTSRPLNEYVGYYTDDLYDKVEIRGEDGSLVLELWDDENLTADLEHWHYDTFRINWRNPAQREEFLQFRLGMDGEVESLDIQFTLRPSLLQVGAYPTDYYRVVNFDKMDL